AEQPAILLRSLCGTARLAEPDRAEVTLLQCLRLPFVFASSPPLPGSRRKPGTRAPIQPCPRPNYHLRNSPITLSSPTIFFMRSKPPARPLHGPAGSPNTSLPRPRTARCSAPYPVI